MSATQIHPVILCGGSGTRLWPLSRQGFPKQLLTLGGQRSLLQETALRTIGPQFAAPLVICNREHRFLIERQFDGAASRSAKLFWNPLDATQRRLQLWPRF